MPLEHVRRNQAGVVAGRSAAGMAARPRAEFVRHIQQTYGNRALQRLLHGAATASRSSATGGVTVQRYGSIRFANLATTKPAYAAKANDIITSLQNTPGIAAFLNNKNTLISLEYEPMLASVRIVADQVLIKLSPWFFEQESRGRILGMLAHEFGVHPLATEAMTVPEQAQEQTDITANTAFPTGIMGHTITPGAAGQTDHIFAAVQGQPRYVTYRKTVHEMTTAMLQEAQQPNATITEAHVTDAIMTYLSDVAMILATNDQRPSIVTNPGRTAECFNLERTAWLAFLAGNGAAGDADLIRLTPPTKTKSDVLGEVGSLAGSVVLSMFTKSTSTDKTVQGTGAQLTTIQQEVLTDFHLVLQPKGGASPSLFDALNGLGLGGVGSDSRLAAFNRLVARQSAISQHSDEYKLLQPVRTRLATGTINTAIDYATLNVVAWALNAKIRVIQPNGQFIFKDYGGGPVHTVLQVDKPAPHYRFAV